MKQTELQIATQKMREHWYRCYDKFPPPTYWGCSPGHSHPKCEEGMRLEKEFLRLIREQIKKDKDASSIRG